MVLRRGRAGLAPEASFPVFHCFCLSSSPVALQSLIFYTGAEDS